MREVLPDELNLTGLLDDREWDGGVKLIVQGAMTTKIADGSIDLNPAWQCLIFARANQRVPLVRLMGDSPKELFEQLAMLAEAGEVEITRTGQDVAP